jgi:hypothetical protein
VCSSVYNKDKLKENPKKLVVCAEVWLERLLVVLSSQYVPFK